MALTLSFCSWACTMRPVSAGVARTSSSVTMSRPMRARAVRAAEPARAEVGFCPASLYLTALEMSRAPDGEAVNAGALVAPARMRGPVGWSEHAASRASEAAAAQRAEESVLQVLRIRVRLHERCCRTACRPR